MKICIGSLKFGEMEFGEMKRNTSNWSNFCILLSRAGLSASAGLSCLQFIRDRNLPHDKNAKRPTIVNRLDSTSADEVNSLGSSCCKQDHSKSLTDPLPWLYP